MKKFDFIPFGAQYYRAPTPLSESWESDFKSMARHGFNTTKIWIQWRNANPREGEYDFSDIKKLMDIAEKNKIKVILNIICDVAPAWIINKFPESLMISNDGRIVEPRAFLYRQIGGSPGPCLHHNKCLHYRKLFIEEASKTFCDHPALLCWDLWNEPELTVGAFRNPKIADLLCYCDETVIKFKGWLKAKYKTIDSLNKAWLRNYNSFDEVETPRTGHTFRDMVDWRMFFAYSLAEETCMRINAVKKYDSEHITMVHTVPMPHFNVVTTGSHDYLQAEECEMFGNSVGSSPEAATLSVSAANDKVVINSEIHAVGGTTIDRPGIPTWNEFKEHIFIPLARGIKGFIFWQYRPELLGLEAPAWGLTAPDGSDTEWLKFAGKINKAVQKHSDYLLEAKICKPNVAIINNSENEIFVWCATHSVEMHHKSVLGAFRMFYDNNYNVDIISDLQVNESKLSQYDVIYYPFPYFMTKKLATALKSYVKKGGTLISEALFGGYNADTNLHSTVVPGHDTLEMFGLREKQILTASRFSDAYGDRWADEEDENTITFKDNGDNEVKGYFYCEEFELTTAKEWGSYDNGGVAVAVNDFGKGKAVMIGTLPAFQYSLNRNLSTSNFICNLLQMNSNAIPNAHSQARIDVLYGKSGVSFCVIDNQSDSEKIDLIFKDKNLNAKRLENILTGEIVETYDLTLNQPVGTIECYKFIK